MIGRICFVLLGCYLMINLTTACGNEVANSGEAVGSCAPRPPVWIECWCLCHPKDPRCQCLDAWNKYCKCKCHPLCHCLKCCKWWQK